jgi:hypothetical protein
MKKKFKHHLRTMDLKKLRILFNEYFATTHLSEELLDMLSVAKQKKFILSYFEKEISAEQIKEILEW